MRSWKPPRRGLVGHRVPGLGKPKLLHGSVGETGLGWVPRSGAAVTWRRARALDDGRLRGRKASSPFDGRQRPRRRVVGRPKRVARVVESPVGEPKPSSGGGQSAGSFVRGGFSSLKMWVARRRPDASLARQGGSPLGVARRAGLVIPEPRLWLTPRGEEVSRTGCAKSRAGVFGPRH